MFRLLPFVLVCLVLQFVSASPLLPRANVQPPGKDTFYEPDNGWENEEPGAILRTRKVELAFLQELNYKYHEAYELLYRTTGAYEKDPLTTVTTIIVPNNAKKDMLVDYNVYIDANGPQCVPSYTLRRGGQLGNDLALTYQQLLFTTLLDEGYVLTIPDYQGPNQGFAVGRMEGRMAIDSVRATLNYGRLGLSKNTKVVGYGYSGGAIATGWAASLQPNYAPELNMMGWSMGGTPANLTGTVLNLDKGRVRWICRGWCSRSGSQGRITKEGQKAIDFARTHCMIDVLLRYPFRTLQSDAFVEDGARILYDPAITKITDTLVLGVNADEAPKAPVYIFHGLHDEVIPFGDALTAANRWADNGADVKFEELQDLLMGHITSELTNLPNVIMFIRDRMQGKSFPSGFTHTRVGNPLEDPNVIGQGFESLVKVIAGFIESTFGFGDKKLINRIKQES
ncbi:hypothetical protein MVES1_002863 [Malassezia vespertilionis]|uniref:uncharacterized protein n=1 Tax=Malassezia vespertilionis TaxID=2020962 RepID=UPI0024B152D3|nr:uncharacterized protein MVES1_002863 [Malassezia vespertilionis]WFD07497.1 hypothetical protein MVES1_002863 [Malassezia vespertilionis]